MTPLLATQVFDRAQAQAVETGENRPASVSVWIVEPIRFVFDKDKQRYIAGLRKRCPNVKIKLMGGFSSLKTWPSMQWLGIERRKLGKAPVVYHCRGEATFLLGEKIATKFAGDALVLDIRGFWPIERLVPQNIFGPNQLKGAQRAEFESDAANLQHAIARSNMVTTVSGPLKQYLVRNYSAPDDTCVVPCCVSSVAEDSYRELIRKQLELGDSKAILYLGGTQKYQHLEDLVLPFFKAALAQSDDCVAVFITQDKITMQVLVERFQLPKEKVRIVSVNQQEVAKYLSAMDAGLLLRAPSFLNNFSQPVKLGEYLSAGLPVIVEKGTGDVEQLLKPFEIGYTINLHERSSEVQYAEVRHALNWVRNSDDSRRIAARRFVEQHYTWKANVQRERTMYLDSLASASAKQLKQRP
ncbi:hypothetical protein [Polluticoccus soli]|uniref:hypothetical protein n=1 Tax=Polluticoccus soli TaxID=3034150 RepID=UPI0023E18394|nr:hypothetical protein [Flavipsychrobacter sp. JY13-12]